MDGLMNIPEVIQQDNLGVAAYLKPSMMLDALRDVVLDSTRFVVAPGALWFLDPGHARRVRDLFPRALSDSHAQLGRGILF